MNLLHLIVPHAKNNHRSKILHHASLFFIIAVFAALNVFGVIVKNTHPEVLGIAYNISSQELLDLVNFEREQNGLSKLVMNAELSKAAEEKATHMFSNNYWAHFAPDGTTPWFFIKNNDYDYLYAGENLAKGFTNSLDAVNAWMDSPTHRANILSPKYNDIGFAISEGKLQGEDTILIVQMFGATQSITEKSSTAPQILEESTSGNANIPVENAVFGNENSNPLVAQNDPLIDVSYSTKVIVFFVLSILITALIIDLIIVEKNKIPRTVGNNFDHIILIILFLVFIFTNSLGKII